MKYFDHNLKILIRLEFAYEKLFYYFKGKDPKVNIL